MAKNLFSGKKTNAEKLKKAKPAPKTFKSGRSFKRFAAGGEVDEATDKAAGLKASENEKIGFFERLRMGNIDDPSSEAYKRFGAGRGRSERVPVEDRTPVPVENKTPAVMRQPVAKEKNIVTDDMRQRAIAEGNRKEGDASVAEANQGKRSVASTSAPAVKPAAKSVNNIDDYPDKTKRGGAASGRIATGIMSGRGGQGGPTAEELENYRQNNPPKKLVSLEDRVAQIPTGSDKAPSEGEKVEPYTSDRQILNAMGATGPALKVLSSVAKSLAKTAPKLKTYFQPRLSAPQKQLTGPSKTDLTTRNRAAREAANKEKMLRENAERYGLNPDSPTFKQTSEAVRRSLGGDEFTVFKKGGKVKSYKAGGIVKTSRGDGIAQRGKTRGKFI